VELLRNRKIPVANMTFGGTTDSTFDASHSTKQTRRKKSNKAKDIPQVNPLEAYTSCNPITPAADAAKTKTFTPSIAEILNNEEPPVQPNQLQPEIRFEDFTYSVEEEEHMFSKIINKTVTHFKLLPIVMQGEQLLGKLKGTDVKDFMDR